MMTRSEYLMKNRYKYGSVLVIGAVVGLLTASIFHWRRRGAWVDVAIDLILVLIIIGWRKVVKEKIKTHSTLKFALEGRSLGFGIALMGGAWVLVVLIAVLWNLAVKGVHLAWFDLIRISNNILVVCIAAFATRALDVEKKRDSR
jgi:hypothetical protein